MSLHFKTITLVSHEYLDRELHSFVFADHLFLVVVLLKELPDGLGVPPDGVRLPLGVGAAGIGLVEARCLVVVEA